MVQKYDYFYRTDMTFYQVCIIFACVSSSLYGEAYLIEQPRNTEAVIGKTVHLNCSTSDQYTVNWEHIPVGSRTPNDVFISSVLVQPYASRLQMRMNKTAGSYDLMFPSVTREDSGTYICIDGAGYGERRESELIVLAGPPTCSSQINPEGVVGVNDCGIEPDQLQFKCHVSFYGNIAPALSWRVTGGNAVTPKTLTVEKRDDQISFTAVIMPNLEVDGHSYTCRLSLSNYSWTSIEVKMLYVLGNSSSVKIPEKSTVICIANSSQTCSYRWIKTSDNGKEIVSHSRSYFVDSNGQFKCLAECRLRGSNCTVQAALLELSIVDRVSPNLTKSYWFLILLSILLPVIIFSFGIFILSRRHLNRQKGQAFHSSGVFMTSHSHIQGTAILKMKLYIIHREQSEISIYGLVPPYNKLHGFRNREIADPRDIVSCSKRNCLYITDAYHKCVFKMSHNKVTTRWLDQVKEPYTLSVNSEGDVVLAECPNFIKVYDAEAHPKKSIAVKEDIHDIQHAVETADGMLLVSHGNEYDRKHEVIMVLKNGETKARFGKERGSQMDQLNQPRHVAIGDDGRVFVADKENNRVFVLSKELKFIQTVSSGISFTLPARLCYENGLFLVGQYNGEVQVFTVGYLDRQRNLLRKTSNTNTGLNIEGDSEAEVDKPYGCRKYEEMKTFPAEEEIQALMGRDA